MHEGTKRCPPTESCILAAASGPWHHGGVSPGISPGHNQPETHPSMKTKATFYHAGCPVCIDAENAVARGLDPARYDVEIVHLGQAKARVTEAEKAGVKSVPALVLGGTAYHINFGAGIEVLR